MSGLRLRRYWLEFDSADACGCGLPINCGVTAFDLDDALDMVAAEYCVRQARPSPLLAVEDFDVSTLDDDHHIRPNLGVPVWRGIWFPFLMRS